MILEVRHEQSYFLISTSVRNALFNVYPKIFKKNQHLKPEINIFLLNQLKYSYDMNCMRVNYSTFGLRGGQQMVIQLDCTNTFEMRIKIK